VGASAGAGESAVPSVSGVKAAAADLEVGDAGSLGGRGSGPASERRAATARRLQGMALPWPVDWAAIFGRDRPLVLEIGFGKGDYLFHLARRFPERSIVGVEVSNRSLDGVERRLLRGEADNVRVVRATAEMALHHLFGPASLVEVHINYPDPWFKKRHGGRRLLRRDVVDAIVDRLRPGGLLFLATDIRAYALVSHAVLSATAGLRNRLAAPWVHAISGRSPTKYELRGLAEGRPGHYFRYGRLEHPASSMPVIQELSMPHIGFSGTVDEGALTHDFEPFDIEAGGAHISVLSVWRGRDALLFEVFVGEPTLSQRLAFVLTGRSDGGAVLTLSRLGLPRPTAGVHHAAAALADWIQQRCPDARVQEDRISVASEARAASAALAPSGPPPPSAAEPNQNAGGDGAASLT